MVLVSIFFLDDKKCHGDEISIEYLQEVILGDLLFLFLIILL